MKVGLQAEATYVLFYVTETRLFEVIRFLLKHGNIRPQDGARYCYLQDRNMFGGE
ncbi:hypothetical protein PAEPH01_1366 [Pancytospora epiphaga]|nr:hypothetical protein PAEPH01_1366 [Pancytospora epiphaga]